MNVYHYCSADSFQKIIQSRSLRLASVRQSNDSTEISWGTQFIKDAFFTAYEQESCRSKSFSEQCPRSLYEKWIMDCEKEYFENDKSIFDCFVSCFSANGDLLSQWRGYADDAAGYAIGFDSEYLEKIGTIKYDNYLFHSIFLYEKVTYRKDRQQAIVNGVASKLIKALKQLLKKPSSSGLLEQCRALTDCAFFDIFEKCICIKNPFFREEKESRLCCIITTPDMMRSSIPVDDHISVSPMGFFTRNNNLVPYADLQFNDQLGSVIKEVIIGPKCTASVKNVEVFLKLNGVDCPVRKSEGTYR